MNQLGQIVPVEITVYEDRSFTFVTKTSPASRLLLEAAGIEKGSGEPNREMVASISRDKVREIAALKLQDLNTDDLEAADEDNRGHRSQHGNRGRTRVIPWRR